MLIPNPSSGSKVSISPGKIRVPKKKPDSIKLLNLLWRSQEQAHFLSTNDRTKSGSFRNIPALDDLEKQIRELTQSGIDLYMACAEFTDNSSRTKANSTGAWAFWIDIDCGKEKATSGQGYTNINYGRKALEAFCRKANIPHPNVLINSGTGIHAYWILDNFLEKARWEEYALKLKALTKELGFMADPSRTSDIASVLRVPNSLNHKYQPAKTVEIIHFNDQLIEVL